MNQGRLRQEKKGVMEEVDRALLAALQRQDSALGVAPPLNPLSSRRTHYDATGRWLLEQASAEVKSFGVHDHALQGGEGSILLREYRPAPRAGVGDPMGLDERLGAAEHAPAKALLWFHGGGWVYGSIDSHDALCRAMAQRSGRVVFSLQYRLAPEHPWPAALEDCLLAWRFLQSKGVRDLVVGGDSSGGHLALALDEALARAGETGPQSLALLYPVVCPLGQTRSFQNYAQGYGLTAEAMLDFWAALMGVVPGQDARARQEALQQLRDLRQKADLLTPATYAARLSGAPAHFLLAELDVLHDEALDLAQRWQQAGRSVRWRSAPGLLHGFARYHGLVPHADTELKDWIEGWR